MSDRKLLLPLVALEHQHLRAKQLGQTSPLTVNSRYIALVNAARLH